MNFHQVQRPIRTASRMQVRRPIFGTSIGRWKQYADLLSPVIARLS